MRVRRRSKILHWEFEFPLNIVSFHLILFNSQFSRGIPVPFALILKVLEILAEWRAHKSYIFGVSIIWLKLVKSGSVKTFSLFTK